MATSGLLNFPRFGQGRFRLRNLAATHADCRELGIGKGIFWLQFNHLQGMLNGLFILPFQLQIDRQGAVCLGMLWVNLQDGTKLLDGAIDISRLFQPDSLIV